MKKLAMAIILSLMAAPAIAKTDNCGYDNFKVEYEHDVDYANACEAYKQVVAFFDNNLGLKVTKDIEITFKEFVMFEIPVNDKIVLERVLGTYNRISNKIEVTTFTTDWFADDDRALFKQKIDRELHISYIAHEITHSINKEFYTIAEPGFAVDEYIAYLVQLSILSEETRNKIIADYNNTKFSHSASINDLVHMVNPHRFGVRSYTHYITEGGPEFIYQIYNGTFVSPTM